MSQKNNPYQPPKTEAKPIENHMAEAKRSWSETLHGFLQPQVLILLFLGFAAGLPLLLIFSSLSLWLREAGIDRALVTMFSWAALGYSFKFVWAPVVDRLPLPGLTKLLGQRRGWLLLTQLAIALAILAMASVDPQQDGNALTFMALAAVALGFSSATQDIVIDAYRIESAGPDLQAMMSSSYIAGYRIGMLVSGAGAIFLAEWWGSTNDVYVYEAWRNSYMAMAAAMGLAMVVTLLMPEPQRNINQTKTPHDISHYLRFMALFILTVAALISVYIVTQEPAAEAKLYVKEWLNNKALSSFIVETCRLALAVVNALLVAKILVRLKVVNQAVVNDTYLDPVRDFFRRYGKQAILLLSIIALYRISDIVLGVVSNVFYQDIGFEKSEIAAAVKTFGLIMTLVGGFLGGILALRWGMMKAMIAGGVLVAATNLLFLVLANVGPDTYVLYIVVGVDNLSAGIASAAFVAFLSSLTNISFTAMQYAIFSSLMTLFPKLIGGYSGAMVNELGYPGFFLLASAMGLPVLVLLWVAHRTMKFQQPKLKT